MSSKKRKAGIRILADSTDRPEMAMAESGCHRQPTDRPNGGEQLGEMKHDANQSRNQPFAGRRPIFLDEQCREPGDRDQR
jgi:hypothetical protein